MQILSRGGHREGRESELDAVGCDPGGKYCILLYNSTSQLNDWKDILEGWTQQLIKITERKYPELFKVVLIKLFLKCTYIKATSNKYE